MRASSGAELEMVVNADAVVMPPITMPMPINAVSRGMPAARREPKVMRSTIAAKTTPKISVTVMPKVVSWNTWPPNSTRSPVDSAIAAVSLRSLKVSSVTADDTSSNCTRVIAMVSSSLSCLPAYSPNGVVTELMPSTFPIAVAIFSMAAR